MEFTEAEVNRDAHTGWEMHGETLTSLVPALLDSTRVLFLANFSNRSHVFNENTATITTNRQKIEGFYSQSDSLGK